MDRKTNKLNKNRPCRSGRKRKFTGNQFSDKCGSNVTSKSAEKLTKSKDPNFDVPIDQTSGYSILHFFLVFSMLSSYLKCKDCNGEVSFNKYGQRGLGFKVRLCCDCGERYIDSCLMIGTAYEVNRRLVFVMRLLGIGIHGIDMFCNLMDLGKGLSISAYYGIVDSILTAVDAVFSIVSRKAVSEEQLENKKRGQPEDILSVSGDGSWSKRGFSSLIGIVSLILKHTGKIVDVTIRSSYCKACEWWKGKENAVNYLAWYEKHRENCNANHEGSAGKMEVDGIVEMFLRSLEKFAVKYGFYIGDGDCKTFKMLLNVFPYGEDFIVKKLECVLHVAKRVFKRANEARKALIQNKKTLKQAENQKTQVKKSSAKKKVAKKVVAKKRVVVKKVPVVKTQQLTIKLMKELSTNYGLAIQRNKDSVENMRRDIWAGFYHKISTDANPQHSYCSIDWCKYRKAEAAKTLHTFKHPPALAQDVQEVLKPIYEDLTKTELLERCLGGHTQNNNESFNKCVWSMAHKDTFNGKKIVEIACKTAACIFNEGFDPVLKIMDVMGIKLGPTAVYYASNRDDARVRLANCRSSESSKEARTKRKIARMTENEHFEEAEGILYGAGVAD